MVLYYICFLIRMPLYLMLETLPSLGGGLSRVGFLFTVSLGSKSSTSFTQLALLSQACLRSSRPDQPVYCNEAGWKLPSLPPRCICTVSCDIHRHSLMWLVYLRWEGLWENCLPWSDLLSTAWMAMVNFVPLSSQPHSSIHNYSTPGKSLQLPFITTCSCVYRLFLSGWWILTDLPHSN